MPHDSRLHDGFRYESLPHSGSVNMATSVMDLLQWLTIMSITPNMVVLSDTVLVKCPGCLGVSLNIASVSCSSTYLEGRRIERIGVCVTHILNESFMRLTDSDATHLAWRPFTNVFNFYFAIICHFLFLLFLSPLLFSLHVWHFIFGGNSQGCGVGYPEEVPIT